MLQLRVEAIKWELSDTATFYLREINGRSIHYKAGQFITLVFSHHAGEIRRSYSLSSSPDEDALAITVKRIANGEISRFMLTKVKPGDILYAIEPAGRFVISNFEAEKDIFLFAAGSGIVPIYSQLKFVLAREGKSCLTLIYSNLNSQSILFGRELQQLSQQHPGRLKIINRLSSEANRLNNLAVELLVRAETKYKPSDTEIYTCGPHAYMRMIRLTLLYMGFDAGQIRKENFVLDTVPVTGSKQNYLPREIKIRFKNELYDLMVGENQSILQAGLQNKIPLPYSCRTGDCSTCAAVCKSGSVEMAKNNVLTDADVAAGWVLTCTAHPVSHDVLIEF